VLQNAFDTTESCDDVNSVVVKLPKLAVMALRSPPERVMLEELILLEVGANSPAFVVRKGVTILLKESVDPRNSAVPTVLEIFERQTTILSVGFLPLHAIFRPHPGRILELALPWLDIAVQVRNELVLLVAETGAKVRDTGVSLLAPSKIGLWDENVTHAQHAQATELLWSIEDDRWESTRHFGVQANFDTGLDLIFTLDEEIKHFVGVNDGLAIIGHQTDNSSVPPGYHLASN
jgi:hypothetical protein